MSPKGVKVLAAGLSLALSFGLAGCSGSEEKASDKRSNEKASDKPSKEKVSAGIQKILSKSASGVGEKKLKKVSDCIADDIYGKVSNETLKSIVEGKDVTDKESKDYQPVYEASKSCVQKVISES